MNSESIIFFFLFREYSLQRSIHVILVIYVVGMYKVNWMLRANMNFVFAYIVEGICG